MHFPAMNINITDCLLFSFYFCIDYFSYELSEGSWCAATSGQFSAYFVFDQAVFNK